jgi:hypothetical protein
METDNLDQATDNQDQTEAPDWREGLDPSIKKHPSIQNFKSPGDLAKSWVEAQKLIGRDKIPVPGDKATKEDWDMVFERLGRPKDKDGYTIPAVKMPDGYPETDKEFMDTFKQKAYDLGMLPNQVNGLYQWFMENESAKFNQYGEKRNMERGEAENALRKLWGKAFEQNFTIAEQAVNKYGTEKFIEKLKATGLNNDPDMVKFIADMAKNFSEDKIAGRPQGLTLSPEEAMHEIKKIQGEAAKDKNHPMNNKFHPEYQYFLDKWKSLHESAYPSG